MRLIAADRMLTGGCPQPLEASDFMSAPVFKAIVLSYAVASTTLETREDRRGVRPGCEVAEGMARRPARRLPRLSNAFCCSRNRRSRM